MNEMTPMTSVTRHLHSLCCYDVMTDGGNWTGLDLGLVSAGLGGGR